MRGTLAEAMRQATKSSLSLKSSSITGSSRSKQLATTYTNVFTKGHEHLTRVVETVKTVSALQPLTLQMDH